MEPNFTTSLYNRNSSDVQKLNPLDELEGDTKNKFMKDYPIKSVP